MDFGAGMCAAILQQHGFEGLVQRFAGELRAAFVQAVGPASTSAPQTERGEEERHKITIADAPDSAARVEPPLPVGDDDWSFLLQAAAPLSVSAEAAAGNALELPGEDDGRPVPSPVPMLSLPAAPDTGHRAARRVGRGRATVGVATDGALEALVSLGRAIGQTCAATDLAALFSLKQVRLRSTWARCSRWHVHSRCSRWTSSPRP